MVEPRRRDPLVAARYDGSAVPRGTAALSARLLAVARRFPHRSAVGDLERSATLLELAVHGLELADRLAAGTRPGVVLVRSSNAIDLAVATHAAAHAGRPLMAVAPDAAASLITELAARIDATALLVADAEHGSAVADIDGPAVLVLPDRERLHALGRAASDVRGPVASLAHAPSHVVQIAPTSGSTGDPKPMRVVSISVPGQRLRPLEELETFEHRATQASAAAATLMRVRDALVDGSRLTSYDAGTLPPTVLVRRLVELGVDTLSLSPSSMRRLVAAAAATPEGLRSVTRISSVGESLMWDDVAAIRRVASRDVLVHNAYASTEAGYVSVFAVPADAALGEGSVPVGRPLPGRRVHIVDEDGIEVPTGTTGRIVVEAPMMSEAPGLEPLPDGRSRLRTSDLGVLDADGTLTIVGRAERMVKVRGARVEPEAVERSLRGRAGILDVAVVPESTGPEHRLVAHVVVDPSDAHGPDDWRAVARERLDAVAVPARFERRTEPLPLLPSGKVDLVGLTRRSAGPST